MINYPIKLQLIFEETNRKKFYSKVDVQLRRRSVIYEKEIFMASFGFDRSFAWSLPKYKRNNSCRKSDTGSFKRFTGKHTDK